MRKFETKLEKTLFEKDREQYLLEKKATNTAFILMFPALIIAMIGIIWSPLYATAIIIALAIYQFLMTTKFIEDYYRR